jgi:hypothetical protein
MLFNVHGILYFEKVFVFCENKISCFFTLLGIFLVFIVFHINMCNQIGAIRWKWIPMFVAV